MAKTPEPLYKTLAKRVYPNGLRVGEISKEAKNQVVKNSNTKKYDKNITIKQNKVVKE